MRGKEVNEFDNSIVCVCASQTSFGQLIFNFLYFGVSLFCCFFQLEGSLLTDGYLDSDYMARHDPRFFLPGSLGQSWQVNKNFRDICLTEVVDYFNHVNEH